MGRRKSKLHPKDLEIKKDTERGLDGGIEGFKKLLEKAIKTPPLPPGFSPKNSPKVDMG